MTDPITFSAATPRFQLPYLFAGQAQKEVFVNEALTLADALLHCAVEAEAGTPPTAPIDGKIWLVGAGATGEWAGRSGQLACRNAGQWVFVLPRDGMSISNLATQQVIRRAAGVWQSPIAPSAPSGGAVIDSEARAALAEIIQRLRQAGIFATP
jgi:hypothetical protein